MLTAPEERQRIFWSMSWHTLNIKNTLLLGFACDGAKISKQEHLHKSGPTAHEVIKRLQIEVTVPESYSDIKFKAKRSSNTV